jgi:hypothetical protein
MTIIPPRHGQDDREQLAQQWPAPPQRDLPEDRHTILREYLMQEIDSQSAPAAARQIPPRRRLALRLAASTAVLAAGAFTAVAVNSTATSHTGSTGVPRTTTGVPPATAASGTDIETVAYTIKTLPGGYVWITLHVHGGNKLDIKQFEADMAKVGVQARVLDCGGTTLGVRAVGLKPESGPIVLRLRPQSFEIHSEADSSNWTCNQP